MDKAVAVTLLVALASVASSSGEVYKVGDKAGWTTLGHVNYTAWAADKNFKVGDNIQFVYNKDYHNVAEVSMEDYKSCNVGSPKATYKSGNDSITINTDGHHYFLCAVPGHCAVGQKVDIWVGKLAPSAAPSSPPEAAPPSAPPTEGTPPTGVAPQPQPSGASATAESKVGGFLLAVLAFAAAFGGIMMSH